MERIRPFFDPKSLALIGATESRRTIGQMVMSNLLAGQRRPVYLVDHEQTEIAGVKCYPSISSLPESPDLVVVAGTAGRAIPQVVAECGRSGVRAMVIVSAGVQQTSVADEACEDEILSLCRSHGMRIVGPNCLGVIRPDSGLNATFATRMPRPGHIAFISQSGAMGSAVLDWAVTRGIGLSAFVSLGSMVDVDFGDLIDYLGEDPQTRSIMVYLESLGRSMQNTRRFISAARGLARSKPIVVIKAGRFQDGGKAVRSCSTHVIGEDLYYQAIFERAGAVRVDEIEDLFNCASILNTALLPRDRKVAIITCASDLAVVATDALIMRGGELARLSEGTIASLNRLVPICGSRSNPIEIPGDANPKTAAQAIEIALGDPGVSGAVVLYTPQGAASPMDTAEAIVTSARTAKKPVLAAMMGSEDVAEARRLLYDNNVPTYEFPEDAVKTYLYMYQYFRNLEELYETPEDLPLDPAPPRNYLRVLARRRLREGRTLLDEEDSKKFLATYGISVTVPHFAQSPEEAASVASSIGYPVAVKVATSGVSPGLEASGVRLNVSSAAELKEAFGVFRESMRRARPEAQFGGVTVQRVPGSFDYEFTIGSKKDSLLGHLIVLGLAGVEGQSVGDVAIGVPPLNQSLARMMLERTGLYGMLCKGVRGRPPVNPRLLEETLVRVSNLITDFPEVGQINIHPLVVRDGEAIALDAVIVLDEEATEGKPGEYQHLIISPYPTKYIQPWNCRDGRPVLLRPIKPEDEPLERELIANLSDESARFRFFRIIRDITHDMLSRFCNIDYDREMAIISEYAIEEKRSNVGVGRLILEPGGESAEFAVLVADDFQGNGLGLKLLDTLIEIAQERGLRSIYGIVLNDNLKMIRLTKKLGFSITRVSGNECRATLNL